MIRIPYAEMVAKIKEKAGLSQEDIEAKVNDKLKQLSGLISKEGAAHIIANELGVKLVEPGGKIKDIYVGMRNVEVNAKVQQVYEIREFARQDGSAGKVGNFLVGDETGMMRVVCWGDKADTLNKLAPDVIVRVTGGMCRDNQGKPEIHLGDNSNIVLNPNGVNIGEVKAKKQESIRKKIKDLVENEENIELLGTVVQVFDPKFYEVCPECNARIKDNNGEFACLKHGKVTPKYGYVVNVFLDDGSENIRCVLFNRQAEFLFNKKPEEMDTFRTAPETFEAIKTDMLGNIIKLVGKVRKNDFFDRLEFMTQLVFPEPDPEEEIQKLKQEQ
ncbi:hypothetical protein KY315_02080 [Candidatus Woesearchaeota archaeon]|nr:hypothetical protein [Candidatus Woesearchaeota archaeon]